MSRNYGFESQVNFFSPSLHFHTKDFVRVQQIFTTKRVFLKTFQIIFKKFYKIKNFITLQPVDKRCAWY